MIFSSPTTKSTRIGRIDFVCRCGLGTAFGGTQWRGAIVSVNEACISLGFLMAFCIGVILAEENTSTSSRRRIMFGLAGILAAIQFLGMLSMPESPIWLQQKGRIQEAKRVYDYIHHSNRQRAGHQQSGQYHCAVDDNNEDYDMNIDLYWTRQIYSHSTGHLENWIPRSTISIANRHDDHILGSVVCDLGVYHYWT